MQIFSSRHTVGATGDQVKLRIGEHVTYRLKNGTIVEAIIDSERMSHSECPNLGYEAYVTENGKKTRNFIDGKRIHFFLGKADA